MPAHGATNLPRWHRFDSVSSLQLTSATVKQNGAPARLDTARSMLRSCRSLIPGVLVLFTPLRVSYTAALAVATLWIAWC